MKIRGLKTASSECYKRLVYEPETDRIVALTMVNGECRISPEYMRYHQTTVERRGYSRSFRAYNR